MNIHLYICVWLKAPQCWMRKVYKAHCLCQSVKVSTKIWPQDGEKDHRFPSQVPPNHILFEGNSTLSQHCALNFDPFAHTSVAVCVYKCNNYTHKSQKMWYFFCFYSFWYLSLRRHWSSFCCDTTARKLCWFAYSKMRPDAVLHPDIFGILHFIYYVLGHTKAFPIIPYSMAEWALECRASVIQPIWLLQQHSWSMLWGCAAPTSQ